jgi:hypothetical protein
MVALLSAKRRKPKPSEIPAALIYEIIDGKPIYYNGYKAVLKGDSPNLAELFKSKGIHFELPN